MLHKTSVFTIELYIKRLRWTPSNSYLKFHSNSYTYVKSFETIVPFSFNKKLRLFTIHRVASLDICILWRSLVAPLTPCLVKL